MFGLKALRATKLPLCMKSACSFLRDGSGATAIEYALIMCLVAVGGVISIRILGQQVVDTFASFAIAFIQL